MGMLSIPHTHVPYILPSVLNHQRRHRHAIGSEVDKAHHRQLTASHRHAGTIDQFNWQSNRELILKFRKAKQAT